jgi:hypothetical protein
VPIAVVVGESGIFIITSGSGSATIHGQTFGLGLVSLLKVKTGSGLGPSSRMLEGSDLEFLLFFTLEQFTTSG